MGLSDDSSSVATAFGVDFAGEVAGEVASSGGVVAAGEIGPVGGIAPAGERMDSKRTMLKMTKAMMVWFCFNQ